MCGNNIIPPAPKPDPKDLLHNPLGGRIDKSKTLAKLEAERKAERAREAGRKAMEARIQVLEDRLGINMPFRISDDLNEVIRHYEEMIAEREMPELEEAVEVLDLENNAEDSDEEMMDV